MKPLPLVLSPQRKQLLLRLVINGLTQAGVLVAAAWLVKQVFDGFIAADSALPLSQLFWPCLGLLCVALSIALLRVVEHVDAEKMGQSYTHDVRIGLFEHMSQLPQRSLQRRSRGGVLLRFIGDLTALKQWVSIGIARLTVASVTCVTTLFILAFISTTLALMVAGVMFAGVVAAVFMGGWLQAAVREARRRRYYLAANVSEKIAAMPVVQVFGQVRREHKRLDKQSTRLMDAMVERARAVGAFRGMVEGVSAIASSTALITGVLLVSWLEATPGTIVAAMSIVGLLTPALRDLGRVQEYWHGAVVSREKIHDFLAMPVMRVATENSQELGDGLGALSFDNVSVAGCLSNFSASTPAGKVVALVGPNGAGKSTVLTLAARLIEADQGQIRLDEQSMDSLKLSSLRKAVGIMSPDLPLLRGTIARNLCYRWPSAPDEAIQRVVELCDLSTLLHSLPEGDQTRLTEEGNNLSLGQRQRLGLARAMLGEPRLLLLDEVDANLDPSAANVLRRILHHYPGTILLVTHRLEWLLQADTVWHIAQGQLLESGTPAELLNRNSATARLFMPDPLALSSTQELLPA